MKGAARLLATVALASATVGCGSRGLHLDGGRSDREVELARRVTELEQRATRLEVELERLRRQVQGGGAPATPAPSTPAAPAAPATPPAPAARAASSAPPLAIGSRRSGAIEERDLPEPAPSSAPAAQEEYDRAHALLDAGRYAEAEAAFARFLEANAGGDLADNAWFWIGESRRSRSDRAGALAAYRKVVEDFPDGNKVPDALFEIGQCLADEGEAADAEEVFQEVLRRFPTSAAAELARQRLEKP